MTLGSKIRKYRKQQGLTQKELAKLSGLNEVTIRSYEADKYNPKYETKVKIAKALKVDIYEFLDDDLFDAATSPDADYEEKLIEEKIKSIVDNTEYSEQEKENLLHDLMTQLEIIANMHQANAEKARTLLIDTKQSESHPFYMLQKKVVNGEQLTREEASSLISYAKEGIKSTSISLKRMGERLEKSYQLLNDEGQKKALEHIEMLTKIPEYQRKEENED